MALLLPAAAMLAATCVGQTRQRGPAGPWVGEVVNYGSQSAAGVAVRANIFDATGAYLGLATVFTCPDTIPPGGQASFEIFFRSLTEPTPAAVLPLRAEFEPVALEGQRNAVTGDGLSTGVGSIDTAKRAALVEVRNVGSRTFWGTEVWANIRGANGEVLEVGSTRLFPSVLRPGESQVVPIAFNSMPPGDIELFARGQDICCGPTLTFNASDFQISASRITSSPEGRRLVVVGEMRNRSGQELWNLRLAAYAKGSPEVRVEAPLACGGVVGLDAPAGAAFSIPLDRAVGQTSAVIVGMEAIPWAGTYAVPTSGVEFARLPDQPDGLGTVAIGATLHNPTSKWLGVQSACATVRDRDGQAMGVVPLFGANEAGYAYIPLLPPGGSLDIGGAGFVLGMPASVEVRAYAEPREQGPIFSLPSP